MTTAVKLTGVLNGVQFFTANSQLGVGVPNSLGYIQVYAAGTTTPINTYTSNTGSVANANPIPLDEYGNLPNTIWGIQGQLYKFEIFDQFNVQQGPPLDNIANLDDFALVSYTFGGFLLVSGSNNVTFGINQTAAEIATSITPSAIQYFPGDIRRFGGGTDNSNFTDYAIDTGTANSYIVKYPFSSFALKQYQCYQFIPANTSTGASTITINGVSGNIHDLFGAAITTNIIAGQPSAVMWDGTNFRLLDATLLAMWNSANRANLAGVALKGITQTAGDSSDNLATTRFVSSQGVFTTTNAGIVPASGSDPLAFLNAGATFTRPTYANSQTANGYDTMGSGTLFQWGDDSFCPSTYCNLCCYISNCISNSLFCSCNNTSNSIRHC